MRGEVWMLGGEEGFRVRAEVVRVGAAEGRGELRGGGVGGHQRGRAHLGVVRLGLGDIGLGGRVQVKLAEVDRVRRRWGRVGRRLLAQEGGVRRVCAERWVGRGEGVSVGQVGVWEERGEGGWEHLGEVRRGEVLGRVLLQVQSLSACVLRRVDVCLHGRPAEAVVVGPFLRQRVCPRVAVRRYIRSCHAAVLRPPRHSDV